MNDFEIMKIQFKHKTVQGKPIACLENLIAVLAYENLKIEVDTVFLSGKKVETINSLIELTATDKKDAQRRWILSVQNVLAIHGLSIDTVRYLPLVDFREFMAGGSNECNR